MRPFSGPKIWCAGLILLAALAANPSIAQLPGASYWGDADGNGIIEVPDLIALNSVLGDPAANDSLLYQGYPQSRFRQDLDGNGIMEVPDLIILNSWVSGDFSNRPGNPDRLLLEASAISVAPGESVTLGAYALSPAAAGSALRTGFGVIFKIDPSGSCVGGELLGYDVAGGATVNEWRASAAYHYTLRPDGPENGRALVKFRGTGCSLGQTVIVNVYIPDDSESGAVPGRFPQRLSAGNINITIMPMGCQQVSAIDVKPSNPVVEQGSTTLFKAVCTLADSTTVDCTNSYCGANTQWSCAGHLTQLIPANLIQAQMGYGSGTVTATLDPGFAPPLTDSELVTVTDLTPPDTSITSAPLATSKNSNASFSFICNESSCSFECMMDSQAWSICSSPAVYSSIADGVHTFLVRAIDSAGNVDPSPSSYTWTIDTVPPETLLSFFPANPTKQTTASFVFSCSGGPCTFECKLDGSLWSACTAPSNYSGLSRSAHTFQVRATDAAGNIDPTPASYAWTVTNSMPGVEFGKAPASGSNRVLVLLVNFADTQPTFTAQDFQRLFFADAPGSMRDFYQKASYGQLNLSGDVVGWIQVSGTHDYYGNSRGGKGSAVYPRNLFGMAEEAIDQAEAMGVDFSNYDNDGDGWVDSLVIIHQGQGNERSGNPNDIRYTMVPLTLGGPMPRFYNNVKVEYFAIAPELAGLDQQIEIGPIAHELGHLLGMKDTYMLYSSSAWGVGNYDLMSYGCWGGNDESPTQPIYPSPFQKELVGWLNPLVISADTILYIPPVETNAYAAKIMFSDDDRDYFMVSNHQPLGYDQLIPASGIMVWHVDKKSYLGNAWAAPLPGRCDIYTPNFHAMLAVEQADGLFEIEYGLNAGNNTDSFSAGTGFSTLTTPDSYTYDCFPSGVEINVLDSNPDATKVQARLRRFQNNSSSPQFWLKEYHFQPVAGHADNDQYPEANEEMRLRVKIMNTGTLAQNVSLQVGSTSPYVTIVNPSASYPDLQAGDSAFNATHIRLRFQQSNCDETMAVIKIQFSANANAYSWSQDLNITIGHPAVLLVDDDGGERTENLFNDALGNNMYLSSFAKWETAKQGTPPLQHMQNHRAVIWVCGPEQNPLSATEINRLEQYLDSGGQLILSSAYLLLNSNNAVQNFAKNYLGLDDWQDNYFAIQNVTGLSRNPVSDGIGDSLLLQVNYVPIYPRNVGLMPAASTMPIFINNLSNTVMVQRYAPGSGSGVIFSSFGLEHLSRNVLYLNYPFNYGLLRRMLNALKYQPGQPVVLDCQPQIVLAGSSGVSLTLTGIDFNQNTTFSFPEPGVQIVSKTFNPADQTVNLVINVLTGASPGWRKISAQNPGIPSAVYDRYLLVR